MWRQADLNGDVAMRRQCGKAGAVKCQLVYSQWASEVGG